MSDLSTFDDETLVDERPAKRQRVSFQQEEAPSSRQLLLEEIDLEISLRQRLAATVQSRLTWALLLQESANRAFGGENETAFRDAALDALDAIEEPCNIIFTRDPRPVQSLTSRSLSTSAAGTPTPVNDLLRAPYTSSSRARGLPRVARPPPKKLLFLRNNTTSPPQIVKLACPDCSRTDFSNLQGLLNHCRLRHQREFGSHDECVQSCAVLVEGLEDQAWIVSNGTEVAGISLPGLRRLFELAVGGGQSVLPSNIPLAQSIVKTEEKSIVSENATPAPEHAQENTPTPSTHLTRTLGLHEDSPALAPFLGRAPKKRCIHTYDEDVVVDIFEGVSQVQKSGQKNYAWRMPYTPRSQAQPSGDEIVLDQTDSSVVQDDVKKLIKSQVPPKEPESSISTVQGLGSRFHIVARVTVEDRSLWIPPGRRIPSRPKHTHRWRLTIASPSYSLPLVNFLDKLTITCLTDPPPSTLVEPVTLSGPPFVLTNTTDRPFLASLTFTWAGGGLNASTTVEHWVELDPLHGAAPVAGDQQVFDVELDRNTELFAHREDQRKISWDDLNDDDAKSGANTVTIKREQEETDQSENKDVPEDSSRNEPGYSVKLKSLLAQVPMTLRDTKGQGRLARKVPYLLVSTPNHFQNLIHGRRKAVEWGRARTLHELYEHQFQEDDPDHVILTTVDVYHWLESQGHFPRTVNVAPKISLSTSSSTQQETNKRTNASSSRKTNSNLHTSSQLPSVSETWCRRCGLHYQLHPVIVESLNPLQSSRLLGSAGESGIKQEPSPVAIPSASSVKKRTGIADACRVFSSQPTQLPFIDVAKILTIYRDVNGHQVTNDAAKPSSMSQPSTDPIMWSSNALVSVAEPRLVVAIQRLALGLRLDHFTRDPSISLSVDTQRVNSQDVTFGALKCKTKRQTEDELAPYALLSILTRSMVKLLIQSGVDAFRRDEAALKTLRKTEKPRPVRSQVEITIRRLLTPSHVLRGLTEEKHGHAQPRTFAQRIVTLGDTHAAVLLMLGPLGMSRELASR